MMLRRATLDDAAAIVAQREDFFAGARVPPASSAELAELVHLALADPRSIVTVLEAGNNSLDPLNCYVGSLALALGRPLGWSGRLMLCDRWIHVRADRRRGAAVACLVRFGLALARHHGVPLYIGNGIGTGRARVIE